VISGFLSCFRLLHPRQKREYWIVAALASLAALMEMVGIASVIPVITALVDYNGALSDERLQWAYHAVGEPEPRRFLIMLAVAAIVTVWLSGVTTLLSVFASQRYLKRLNADLSVRVYERYMSHSIEKFYGRASSEFIRNVNGMAERISMGAIGASITAIARSIQILAFAIILFIINFKVTSIILLVICGSYAGIFLSVRHRLARMTVENLSEVRTLQQLIIGSYQAYRSITLDQQLPTFISHFRRLKAATSRKAANIEIIGSTPRQVIEIIGITLLVLASYIIGHSAQNSHQFVAVISLFGIAAYRLLPSAQQLYNSLNRITAALAAYRTVAHEWGSLRGPISTYLTPCDRQERPTKLVADSIFYAFGERELFNGLSISLKLSGLVRIGGASGAGKSTFIELLAGLRQPHRGKILINDKPLSDQRRLGWWAQISYLSQTDYIFEGTIRQNVILDRVPDESRFTLVAGICGLQDLVETGPLGSKLLQEGGANLSGGQRSRVLLARALYKNSDVLFLDEAFSALDVNSARNIISRVLAAFPERCVIVVSHREAELPAGVRTVLVQHPARIRAS
jgi:ATP-binding cassette, subfamily B, bacterial PglK